MIIILIQSPSFFRLLSKLPFLKFFFQFSPKGLHKVDGEKEFVRLIDKIKLANGSFKTTKSNRFKDIDNYLLSVLSPHVEYKIHDIAVSDGITSVELQENLESNRIKHKLTISDKYSKLLYDEDKGLTTYYDQEGNILITSYLGIKIDKDLNWKFFISKLLGYLIKSDFAPLQKKRSTKEILLINPKTSKRIDNEKIAFKYYDIFKGDDESNKYDIIRCLNILNPNYFNSIELTTAIRFILSNLAEEGILIVGRTEITTGKNLVSFFRFQKNKLIVEKRFNGGAEIENLVEMTFAMMT